MRVLPFVLAAVLMPLAALAQKAGSTSARRSSVTACAACIRAHMEFLAGDELRGRGCGTEDEHVAAMYVASELRQYGIEAGGSQGSYFQTVDIVTPRLAALPSVEITDASTSLVIWKHGTEILFVSVVPGSLGGPLQKLDSSSATEHHAIPGAVVFFRPKDVEDNDAVFSELARLFREGAAAILLPPRSATLQQWSRLSGLPQLATEVAGVAPLNPQPLVKDVVRVRGEALATLEKLPEGTTIRITAEAAEPTRRTTRNVIGVIHGITTAAHTDAVLVSAHYDALGVGTPVNGDAIYNGADDDASGTTAVLELARAMVREPRPRRSLYFVMFGCEEAGELGALYFRTHPPVPLQSFVANIEFEMIGLQDTKMPPDTLLLTGWDRSNLGPVLSAHGALLGPDPYPELRLFEHSDNYALAQLGVIAQTAGSAPVISTYHRPDDDLQHVDLSFVTKVIGSMIRPLRWLANSNFKPSWDPGKRP